MNKAFLILLSALTAFSSTNAQLLVGAWDFQTTTTGGTAASASVPKVYLANFGSGTLYMDGSFGSSNWTSGSEFSAFSGFGSNLNTSLPDGGSLSTDTSGYGSIAYLPGTSFSANGKSAVFKFSMAGKSDLDISYAARRGLNGFSLLTWDYSTDGTNYSSIGSKSIGNTGSSYTVHSLATVTGLNGDADAYVRVTFSGAVVNSSGALNIDNIQFNAVPEPSALSLLAVGLGGLAILRRRRRG